jgi:hypothetical protein
VLGEAQEDVRRAVAGVEIVVVDLAGEDDLVEAQLPHQLLQAVEVTLEPAVVTDEEEAASRVDPPLKSGEDAHQILDALVRDDPTHEEDVRAAVVEQPAEDGRGGARVATDVEDDGQHAGGAKPRLLELPAVELAVPESELGAGGKGGELTPAVVTQPGEVGVEAEEEAGGGDVVVDDDEAVGGVEGEAARRAADREVEEAHRLRRGHLPVFPQRAREVGHPGMDLLGEDVRRVAGGTQVSLDGESLVRDRVAIGQGGQELVDAPGRARATAAHSPARPPPAPSASSPERTVSSSVFSRRASISSRPVS